jgi:hypothetical protein
MALCNLDFAMAQQLADSFHRRATQQKVWIGHSNGNDITARYDKSAGDKEWRQTWANKCGVGFALPEIIEAGYPAPKSSRPSKVFTASEASSRAESTTSIEVAAPVEPAAAYIAKDSDLDSVFFQQEV